MNPIDHPWAVARARPPEGGTDVALGQEGRQTRKKGKYSTPPSSGGAERSEEGRGAEVTEQGSVCRRPSVEEVDELNKRGDKRVIKTWSRRSTLIRTWWPHAGGARRPQARAVYVTESMVGHKLGEFAPTRTFRTHGHHTERSSRLK